MCDVCGGKDAETVTVSWRGKSFIVDLCGNETSTVESWEQAGSLSPRKRTQSRKPKGHSVTPID